MTPGTTPGRSAGDRWSPWLRSVALCGVPAFFGASFLWGTGRAVSLVAPVLLAVMMAGIAVTHSATTGGDGQPPSADVPDTSARRRELARWCRVAAACAAIVLLLAVVSVLSAWWVPLTAAVLVVTTPPARDFARTHVLHRAGSTSTGNATIPEPGWPPGRAPDDGAGTVAEVSGLDTAELCHLWRVTFWMVRDLRAPARTLRVVELRQEVLDELHRRHPDQVERWLSSGRHGADGPARYL
ncbi:hypothetical protein [Nocardioides xinjiangensis]|uniref:hypothetical protein n=1 Tax=Nocardioides xinjiangensis TaxID=2817376 RepID=UPI001B30A288|nr:hypothetical protein [Nocardioides sp. SYSU D00514]